MRISYLPRKKSKNKNKKTKKYFTLTDEELSIQKIITKEVDAATACKLLATNKCVSSTGGNDTDTL